MLWRMSLLWRWWWRQLIIRHSCYFYGNTYRAADKSLARPGRKQARKHVRDARGFNNIKTRAVIKFFFLQGKAPKEIQGILTETLACFLPGRAKDLSAPHVHVLLWHLFIYLQFRESVSSSGHTVSKNGTISALWVWKALEGRSYGLNWDIQVFCMKALRRTTKNFSQYSQSQNAGTLEYEAEILSSEQRCSVCSFVDTVTSRHYLLTPWCRVLLEKLTGLQQVKKFPAFQRNPKVHYRTHKRPPPVSILGQPNPVHIHTSHLLEIQPNIIHPSTPRFPQWSLSLRFPHQEPIHPLSSPICATCPAYLILLDFITRTILGEEYKSFSSTSRH